MFLSSTAIECSTRRLRLRYGTVSMTSHYYGGIVTYMCSDGYVLTGPQNRRCSKDGKWQPRINPFCTGTKNGVSCNTNFLTSISDTEVGNCSI